MLAAQSFPFNAANAIRRNNARGARHGRHGDRRVRRGGSRGTTLRSRPETELSGHVHVRFGSQVKPYADVRTVVAHSLKQQRKQGALDGMPATARYPPRTCGSVHGYPGKLCCFVRQLEHTSMPQALQ